MAQKRVPINGHVPQIWPIFCKISKIFKKTNIINHCRSRAKKSIQNPNFTVHAPLLFEIIKSDFCLLLQDNFVEVRIFNIIKITFFTELGMYALAQAYIFRLITMIFSWTSVDYYIYRELSVATTQAPKDLGPQYSSKKLANQVDLQDQLLARNCVFIILRPEPSPYLHKIQYSLIYIIQGVPKKVY